MDSKPSVFRQLLADARREVLSRRLDLDDRAAGESPALDVWAGKPNPWPRYVAMHPDTFERITGVSADSLPSVVD